MNAPITPAELRACLDRYALRVLQQPHALSHGTVSRVSLAQTQHGPVVVKRHSGRFEPAQIHLALEAHAHACAHDLAPPLLTTAEGQRAVLLGPFWYSVTEYAETVQSAADDHRVLGRAVAALHTCLSQFTPTNEGTAGVLQLHQDPIAVLRRIQADRAAGSQIHDEIDWRVSILQKAGLAAEELAACPREWVHGDVRSENLLAAGSPGRWWFIDFDQISRFPRPYEIVRAFAASFRTSARIAFARQFAEYLAAYRDVRPIPAHESAQMIDLYITVQAGETRTFTTPEGEVRGMADYARTRRQLLTWIVKHRDELTAAARQGADI